MGSQGENPQVRQRRSSWANWDMREERGWGRREIEGVCFVSGKSMEQQGKCPELWSLQPQTQDTGTHDRSRMEPLPPSGPPQMRQAKSSDLIRMKMLPSAWDSTFITGTVHWDTWKRKVWLQVQTGLPDRGRQEAWPPGNGLLHLQTQSQINNMHYYFISNS